MSSLKWWVSVSRSVDAHGFLPFLWWPHHLLPLSVPFPSPSFLKWKLCFFKCTYNKSSFVFTGRSRSLMHDNHREMNKWPYDSFLACLWVKLFILPLPSRRTHAPLINTYTHTSLSLNLLSPLHVYSLRCWSSWLESRSCGWTGTDWRFYLGYNLQSFLYTNFQLLLCPKTSSWDYFTRFFNLHVCVNLHQNEPRSVCIRLSALWKPAEKELQFRDESLAGWTQLDSFYRDNADSWVCRCPSNNSKQFCSCEVIIFLEHN